MSDISVEKEIVMRSVGSIRPYERNPRKNDKTVELLVKVIPKVGFNVPIVIDADGVIVKGHARYAAAQKLGLAEVPCIVTHADADAIKADRIADNKVSEFSEWVNQELMHEVDMLTIDIDLADMGLPRISYDDIPSLDEFVEEGEDADTATMSEEERRQLYEQFLERQAQENAVSVQMTSSSAIREAVTKQNHVPSQQRTYLQCNCKKCGQVLYVDKTKFFGQDR